MSKPTTWRLPVAALSVVLVQLLTVVVLLISADEVQVERSDAVRDAAVTRCGEHP